MQTDTANPVATAIRHLALGENVPGDVLGGAFETVMSGGATPVQIAALLMGLRAKGETASELAAIVRVLRGAMVVLAAERREELVDTCGTGGGVVPTFNISTAAALLAAGAGVRVAKHGNRSFTTRSGSADVLEALGVAIDVTPEVMADALARAGIVFMFAPLMHPSFRHVGPIRKELGVPTVMNIVGPLANPARAGRQVIGVADEQKLALIASAVRELGATHALVVHGSPGMDEISPLGTTRVVEIRGNSATEWTIEPERWGLAGGVREELAGGSPADNAATVVGVLEGKGTPAARAAVVLNAAAAIYVSGATSSYDEAVERAQEALAGAMGIVALERLRGAMAGR